MRVYQIFVDRFSTGVKEQDIKLSFVTSRRRLGGNLNGVIKNLKYIKALGFDAIWLTPIFSANDYHGYSTLDFYNIDEHFGSKETLKKLVYEAHKFGIKIILDFVANHVSVKHKFFLSAISSAKSEYRNWFVFYDNKNYLSFLNVKELPKLNTRNQDVINYLIDAATYWIKNFDIDGFRLDHAIGPSMEFWEAFVRECIRINRNFVFLPEIWLSGIDPTYLDTLWFIEDGEKKDKLRAILLKNRGKIWDKQSNSEAEEFAMQIFHGIFKTPLNFSINMKLRNDKVNEIRLDDSFVFADNHDMQRLAWIYRKNTEKIKYLLKTVLSAKNSIIYYGTEIMMSQKKDFSQLKTFQDVECRRFMDWRKVNKETISSFTSFIK